MATLIDVPQMIDLALGSPEVGVINFNILNTLLHIIVNHINMDSHRIEFRGSQANIVENLMKSIPSEHQNIMEINVKSSNNDEKQVQEKEKDQEKEKENVIEKEKENPIEKPKETEKEKKLSADVSTIIVVQKSSEINMPRTSIKSVEVASQEDFNALEKKVDKIEEILAPALTPNIEQKSEIGELDVTTFLDLSTRVNSIESSIQKMTNIFGDVLKEVKKCEAATKQFKVNQSEVSALKDKIDEVFKIMVENGQLDPKRLSDIDKHAIEIIRSDESRSRRLSDIEKLTLSDIKKEVPRTPVLDQLSSPDIDLIRRQINETKSVQSKLIRQLQTSGLLHDQFSIHSIAESRSKSSRHSSLIPSRVPSSLESMKLSEDIQSKESHESKYSETMSEISDEQLAVTENRMKLIELKILSLEKIMDGMDNNVKDLQNCVACMDDRLPKPEDRLAQIEMENKFESLKESIEMNNKIVCELEHERNKMFKMIERHDEQIQELLVLKVDKEEMDMALLEKADYVSLKSKVSNDEFNTTRQQMESYFKNTILHVQNTEDNMKIKIQEITDRLLLKVGQPELDELKDYFNNKYQALQERLKALAALRRDTEAAATKSKYLRDVNCVSCAENAIMKMDEASQGLPMTPCVPINPSMKPFLAFKLDQVRGEMTDCGARNMHHYERLTKENEKAKKTMAHVQRKNDNFNRKHLCSRFCGGSHTKISVEDRFLKTRLGPKVTSAYEPCNTYMTVKNMAEVCKPSVTPNLTISAHPICTEFKPESPEIKNEVTDKTEINAESNVIAPKEPLSVPSILADNLIESTHDNSEVSEIENAKSTSDQNLDGIHSEQVLAMNEEETDIPDYIA